jgi:hypothetical protein
MTQEYLFNFGIEQLKKYELDKKRISFQLDDNIINLVDTAIDKLSNDYKIDLSKFSKEQFEKENTKDFYMNWHIDDCYVFRHTKTDVKEKFVICHKNKLPTYTMIIYLSTHDKDFTGGEFLFVNQKIFPKKKLVLFFDSREVHKVNKINSGIRKNILIKFY